MLLMNTDSALFMSKGSASLWLFSSNSWGSILAYSVLSYSMILITVCSKKPMCSSSRSAMYSPSTIWMMTLMIALPTFLYRMYSRRYSWCSHIDAASCFPVALLGLIEMCSRLSGISNSTLSVSAKKAVSETVWLR